MIYDRVLCKRAALLALPALALTNESMHHPYRLCREQLHSIACHRHIKHRLIYSTIESFAWYGKVKGNIPPGLHGHIFTSGVMASCCSCRWHCFVNFLPAFPRVRKFSLCCGSPYLLQGPRSCLFTLTAALFISRHAWLHFGCCLSIARPCCPFTPLCRLFIGLTVNGCSLQCFRYALRGSKAQLL